MQGIGVKIVGLLLALVVFTIGSRFDGDSGGPRLSAVPATVFDGGDGTLSIEFTSTQPVEFNFYFSQYDWSGEVTRELGGEEAFIPGTHHRTIDVSPSTGVYLEIGVPDATPGAELSWTIDLDGQKVFEESHRLEQALTDGYAFFVNFDVESLEEIRSWSR